MLFAVNIQPKSSNTSWAFSTPLVTLINIHQHWRGDSLNWNAVPPKIGCNLGRHICARFKHPAHTTTGEVPWNRQLCKLHKLTAYRPMAPSTSLHCHSSLGPALGRLSTAKSTCSHDSTATPKILGRTGIVAKCAGGKVSRKQLFAVLAAEEQGIIMWNSEIAESSKWAFCTHS